MRIIGVVLGTTLLAAAAMAQDPGSGSDTAMATVKQIMLGITIPASDIVWGVDTPEEDADAYWENIEANAMVLAESGALLMTPGRAVDQDDWMSYAQDLIDSSLAAAQSARAHDIDQIFEDGNVIYEACDDCHAKYMPARQGE